MAFWNKDKKEEVLGEKAVVTDEKVKTNLPDKTDEVMVSKLPDATPEPAVIEAAPTAPLVTPEIPKGPVVDALGLVYFVWLLLKLNIITRIQVRDFLDIIRKGDWPKDVVKELTDEVKKL